MNLYIVGAAPFTIAALVAAALALALYKERQERLFWQLQNGAKVAALSAIGAVTTDLQAQQTMLLDYAHEMEDAVLDVTALNADLHDNLKAAEDKVRMLNNQTVELETPDAAKQIKALQDELQICRAALLLENEKLEVKATIPKRPARTKKVASE